VIPLSLCLSLSGRNRFSEEAVKLWDDPDAPGWVTDGYFCAYVGLEPHPLVGERSPGQRPPLGKMLARYQSLPTMRLQERPELLIPPRRTPCSVCKGRGWQTFAWWKPNGNGPPKRVRRRGDCYECEGLKTFLDDAGQSVWEDDAGRATVLSPERVALLSGLAVWRIEDEQLRVGERPVAGFCETGRPLVVLMPMRADVRRLAGEEARP
jgi:hypothetical protein